MQTIAAEPYLNSPKLESAPVCATLALLKARGSFLKVRGASGKGYEFRWSEKHQRMIREYRSPADFTREETDLRKNVKGRFSIVTMLGAVHPVIHAKEALAALVNAGGAVQIPERVAALRDLADTAYAAILTLTAPPPQEAEPQAEPQAEPPPQEVVQFHEDRWVGDDGLPVIEPPPKEPGATQPITISGRHTHAELMQGEWKSVKLIARSFNIVIAQKNKMQLADEILAKQASGVRPQEALAKEGE